MASLVLKKGVFIVLCVFMQKERKAPFKLLYLKQHEQERKNMQHSSKVNKHAVQTASKQISKMRQMTIWGRQGYWLFSESVWSLLHCHLTMEWAGKLLKSKIYLFSWEEKLNSIWIAKGQCPRVKSRLPNFDP